MAIQQASLSCMGGGWEEGEMSLKKGVKAKELPQGIANEVPLRELVAFWLVGWFFALDKGLENEIRCGCGP